MNTTNDKTLFCDLKTDEEKSNFFLSGRGYETGIIALSIQNDVAMAYHRCAEYRKELEDLRENGKQAVPEGKVLVDRGVPDAPTWEQIQKAWYAVGADVAGLDWSAFVRKVSAAPAAQQAPSDTERNAARYLWLRERVSVWRTDGKGPVSWFPVIKVPASSSLQDETDAAIDAAMKGEA